MRNSLFSWNWRGTVGQEKRSHKLECSQDTKGRPLKLEKKCYWSFTEYKQSGAIDTLSLPVISRSYTSTSAPLLLFSPCPPGYLSAGPPPPGKRKIVVLCTAMAHFLKYIGACRIILVHPLWEVTGLKYEAGWGLNTSRVFLMNPF